MSTKPIQVGAVMYPGFEMLDMFGPLEMFSILAPDTVSITMLAESPDAVPTAMGSALASGPKVAVDAVFNDAPDVDILLVPGGFGTLAQLDNPAMLEFLRQAADTAQQVCSVCTGSLLLAKAGLLDGRRATTNKLFFGLGDMASTAVQWVTHARWVEDDRFFTSSGVSAGMDMTLALIAKRFGDAAAESVAMNAEYTWHRDADSDPFAQYLNEGLAAMQTQ